MGKVKILISLIFVFVLTSCAGTQPQKTYNTIINKKYKIQFNCPDQNWKKVNPGKFNIYCFRHKIYNAKIWIRAKRLKKEPTLTSKESANLWIKAMATKYNWKDVETIADGGTKINDEKIYWKTFLYFSRNIYFHEKIYRVYFNKIGYQFRFVCAQKTGSDELLKEFESWTKTIKFIR